MGSGFGIGMAYKNCENELNDSVLNRCKDKQLNYKKKTTHTQRTTKKEKILGTSCALV